MRTSALAIVSELLEWHENARLEAVVKGEQYLFARNNQPAGEFILRRIQDRKSRVSEFLLDPKQPEVSVAYLLNFGVSRSLQGTGFGRAMISFAFEKNPKLKRIDLHCMPSARQFYKNLGATPDGPKSGAFGGVADALSIYRQAVKPSPYTFTELSPSDWDAKFDSNDSRRSRNSWIDPWH